MIISHRNKFIFIHINKCAGTSITRALLPFLGPDDLVLGCTPEYERLSNDYLKRGLIYKHSTANEIKKFIGDETWENYFVFSFVRNPWDIVVSKYFWWHKTPADWSEKAKKQKKLITRLSFKDYILNKKFGVKFSMAAFLRTESSTESNPFPEIDFIGTFENLQSDFNMVCSKTGLPKIILSKMNTSNELRIKNHFTDFYDPETREIVRKAYKEDIRLFGYTFPV